MDATELPLQISERDGRVRLRLGGFSYAEGETLQEAADNLVRKMLVIAMAFRSGGISSMCSECRPDLSVLDFVEAGGLRQHKQGL